MISGYRFGHVTIDGAEFTADVIVHGSAVQSWWRATSHSVARDDLAAVVAEKPAALVVGTGAFGLMRVPEDTRRCIEEQGIRLVVGRTARAVEEFNRLQGEGVDAAIAMHLTC